MMPSSKFANLMFFILTIISLLIIILLSFNQKIEGNLSGQQAMAFLRGELTIPNDDALTVYQDLVFYKGKIYSPLPPGPAVLLIPFVLIGGPKMPILILTIPLTLLSLLLLIRIYDYIPEAVPLKRWLAFGFIFGTALLPCLQVGGYA